MCILWVEGMEERTLSSFHSTAPEGGSIWVFTPDLCNGEYLWIRLVERRNIVVISFHEG